MLSEARGYSFEQCLEHEIIKKFKYNFGKDGFKYSGMFFNWEPKVNCSQQGVLVGSNEVGLPREYIYANMRRVCRKYIINNLEIPSILPFGDDTLVIHIRGGDSFDREFIIPINYVQNPLSYYLSLIDQFKEIIVVEPNSDNPVVPELKKIKKLTFQSSSVAQDYATLLATKNLATSGVGTFAISAALCSNNIKNIFSSDAYLTEHLNCSMLYGTDVTVHEIKLKNYIPVHPCSWKNDVEQRKLMLEYKMHE